mmetsp:Transcript_36247/g.81628  ORF Transcript_36247/g.81628 Transcript_36247/m.81628 type:complete len:214 (+) Transcript_36247:422-1063(+)
MLQLQLIGARLVQWLDRRDSESLAGQGRQVRQGSASARGLGAVLQLLAVLGLAPGDWRCGRRRLRVGREGSRPVCETHQEQEVDASVAEYRSHVLRVSPRGEDLLCGRRGQAAAADASGGRGSRQGVSLPAVGHRLLLPARRRESAGKRGGQFLVRRSSAEAVEGGGGGRRRRRADGRGEGAQEESQRLLLRLLRLLPRYRQQRQHDSSLDAS